MTDEKSTGVVVVVVFVDFTSASVAGTLVVTTVRLGGVASLVNH